MKRSSGLNWLIAGLAVGTAAVPLYQYAVRPWHLRWGATESETARALPGDDLLLAPRLCATHAITIQAPPGVVYPWLLQMGQGRGGFYSYDWIENIFGLEFRSADRILPEWQTLKVGDIVPLAPGGFGPRVALLEPNRALVLHGDTRLPDAGTPSETMRLKPGDFMAVVWTFFLEERADGATRLIERFMADYNPTPANTFFYRVMLEPASFVMERGMLLGIRTRAEQATAPAAEPAMP
jgi:hypothetical protein